MIKRIILILLCAFGLIGCVPSAYVVSEGKSSGSIGSKSIIIIEDKRPDADKKHSIGSLLVTSKDYGVWTLGDEQFQPSVLELLKKTIAKVTVDQESQPSIIRIELKRFIIQANHQADLLQTVSSTQTPLAVAIAETLHGKEFEQDINKTKPYIIGFIDSIVTIQHESKKEISKKLSLVKAENFRSHVDESGRKEASIKVVKELTNTFSHAIYAR